MNVPSRFVKQHGRLSWKARITRPCDEPWWQDRVPGESSKLEIKLRSGERATVGGCVLDTLAGMARAIALALCPGSKNVRIAYRHQLLKVSQEQLRMATVTERVADDVTHQEFGAICEISAADGQALPKYLDISRDPPPPSADESTQTSPEERAERRDRFENRSSGSGAQTGLVQPRNTENSVSPEEYVPRGRESETEYMAPSENRREESC